MVEAENERAVGPKPSSFSGFYDRELEPMVRFAYLLTGQRAVAEDLVHDSFLRLHQHWDDVRSPRPYLRQSVANACRAHHRRIFRERARFPDLVTDHVSRDTPVILDAVSRLPYRQRAALVLRFYEDWPEEQIAQMLRCRPATVRSLVRRGLLALREVMEP